MGDIQPAALKPLHIKAKGSNHNVHKPKQTPERDIKNGTLIMLQESSPKKIISNWKPQKKRQLYQKFHTKNHNHNPNPQPQA